VNLVVGADVQENDLARREAQDRDDAAIVGQPDGVLANSASNKYANFFNQALVSCLANKFDKSRPASFRA